MEKIIKVSVIVPVYNTEKYLNRCLDSLVNQSLKEKIYLENSLNFNDTIFVTFEINKNGKISKLIETFYLDSTKTEKVEIIFE